MNREIVKEKRKSIMPTRFLKYMLPLFIFLFTSMLIFVSSTEWTSNKLKDRNSDYGVVNVSEAVLQYEPTVEKYAEKYGVEEYTGVILAMMMQETGGRGDDPMQASESLCGSIGCITDPELSIKQGVYYFSEQLERAGGDLKLTIQSYNFGGGFIDYVMERGGEYTKELAIQFSQEQYEKLAHTGNYSCLRPEAMPLDACYGDIFYVEAVMQYYDFLALSIEESA